MSLKAPSDRIVTGPLARTLFWFGAPLALGMGLQTTFNLVVYVFNYRRGGYLRSLVRE